MSEHDGVRIISHDRCDFLQKVPRTLLPSHRCSISFGEVDFLLGATENVFKPGSSSPAAILLDAFDLYEKKSPRADEIIRNIRPELASAVDILTEAAGQELEPYWQKRLLNVSALSTP